MSWPALGETMAAERKRRRVSSSQRPAMIWESHPAAELQLANRGFEYQVVFGICEMKPSLFYVQFSFMWPPGRKYQAGFNSTDIWFIWLSVRWSFGSSDVELN